VIAQAVGHWPKSLVVVDGEPLRRHWFKSSANGTKANKARQRGRSKHCVTGSRRWRRLGIAPNLSSSDVFILDNFPAYESKAAEQAVRTKSV
jgi:hypothetical protein